MNEIWTILKKLTIPYPPPDRLTLSQTVSPPLSMSHSVIFLHFCHIFALILEFLFDSKNIVNYNRARVDLQWIPKQKRTIRIAAKGKVAVEERKR